MWKNLRSSPTGIIGLVIFIMVVACGLLASFISPYNPGTQDIENTFMPPFWNSLGGIDHLLGTDDVGKDVLSNLIYGSRISLMVGFFGTIVAGCIGVLLGSLSGYYGGKIDTAIMRIADIQLAFPFILLAIFIVAVLGPSLSNIIIVAGISSWVQFARLVRGEIIAVKENEYIEAIRSLGAKSYVIIFKHILPNIMNSVIVVATLEMARIILMEASLSFLGLGVPAEVPTWGKMLADARVHMVSHPWLAILPGLSITFTVLGINLFGDWLRDYLDPKLRETNK